MLALDPDVDADEGLVLLVHDPAGELPGGPCECRGREQRHAQGQDR